MDVISATLICELNKASSSRENGKNRAGAIAKVARPPYQPAREAAEPRCSPTRLAPSYLTLTHFSNRRGEPRGPGERMSRNYSSF